MTVRVVEGIVHLEGACRVEDAEPLAAALHSGSRVVDLHGAGPLHTAVVQVLMAFRPTLRGTLADAFAARRLMPFLGRVDGNSGIDPS